MSVGRLGQRLFAWRRHPTAYRVLVAEILLQHTPADRVALVFEEVMARWQGFVALAGARQTEVERVLRPLGLHRRRAAALVRLARAVVRLHGGRLPRRREVLERLSGVGRYTAGATLAVTISRADGFADAGMGRLVRRYFGAATATHREVHELVRQVLAGRGARWRLWGLLDVARTYCRPVPDCGRCKLVRGCAHVALRPKRTA